MASDERLTKTQRRDQARRKAAELRARQERERRRNKIIGIGLLVVAVVAIGAGIFAVVKKSAEVDQNKERYADAQAPTSAPDLTDVVVPKTGDAALAGIPISSKGVGVVADDGVVVHIYLDFICPHCAEFERDQAASVQEVLTYDDVTVVYHAVALFDHWSEGTNYSSRAANAVSVVADQDPDHFLAFVVALMDPQTQPRAGTGGLTDAKIAQIAQQVGVPSSVTDQFTATADFQGVQLRTFVPWTLAVTQTTPIDPVKNAPSTPAILINGEHWYNRPGVKLADAVAAARTPTTGGTTTGQD
ncbi:MAG: thioredoxin domain-containing protein [Micrococcales bacterium]|nr:thioredoxin domain-containing protein [Micrococcales bacterium]